MRARPKSYSSSALPTNSVLRSPRCAPRRSKSGAPAFFSRILLLPCSTALCRRNGLQNQIGRLQESLRQAQNELVQSKSDWDEQNNTVQASLRAETANTAFLTTRIASLTEELNSVTEELKATKKSLVNEEVCCCCPWLLVFFGFFSLTLYRLSQGERKELDRRLQVELESHARDEARLTELVAELGLEQGKVSELHQLLFESR